MSRWLWVCLIICFLLGLDEVERRVVCVIRMGFCLFMEIFLKWDRGFIILLVENFSIYE